MSEVRVTKRRTEASKGPLIGTEIERGRITPAVLGVCRRTNVPGPFWRRIPLVRIDVSGYEEIIGCRPKNRL